MSRPRAPPAERVRARLRAAAGGAAAAAMPSGYQRLGSVLLLRLPPALRPQFALLGAAWRKELGVRTVLVRTGPVEGEFRQPTAEVVAGDRTETEVVEHGTRWRFDAARLMFAAGNRVERQRFAGLVRPGERVADLFAGIGYFAIPAARRTPSARIVAVEKNPVAFRYLLENVRSNGVTDRVTAVEGDNRSVVLPIGAFDRVLLGYLPDALPWIGRAIELVRPEGGWVHLHTVSDARAPLEATAEAVRTRVVAEGRRVEEGPRVRDVKPYGPGRTHRVADVRVGAAHAA